MLAAPVPSGREGEEEETVILHLITGSQHLTQEENQLPAPSDTAALARRYHLSAQGIVPPAFSESQP